MNNYTVYCHIFPNKKRYIGITKQTTSRRWQNGYGYICSPLMYNAIKKYLWHNIEHKILYTNLSKKEAEDTEIKLIKEWKTNIIKYGYNIANGGSLASSFTLETRLKISRSQVGKKLSEETKNKIRLANSGSKNYLYGKVMSFEKKQQLLLSNYKQISQYNINGDFLENYNCIKEASIKYKINNSNISQCCMNKRKTAGGYKWKYKDMEVMAYQ